MFLKISAALIFLLILYGAAHSQRTIDGEKLGIVNGKATSLPKPEYPPEAKDFCAGGKVEIKVLIGEKGDVLEAEAISGDELLRGVSVDAVRKAKFIPVHSWPVKVKGIVVYNFDFLSPKCITVGIVNKKALNLPPPKVANLSPPKKESIMAVRIIVDESGKVTQARAVFGHPLLRAACEAAARQAKFSPSFINGPPVKVRALLVYKFKPDGSVDTKVEQDDKTVIGTPVNLVEPPPPFCNCRGLGGQVLVEAKIDEQGNVTEAKAVSGHPILKNISEKAALESKFLPTSVNAKIHINYNFDSRDGGRTAKIKNIEIKQVEIEK